MWRLPCWSGLDLKRPARFLPYWDQAVAAALSTGQDDVFASAWRQDDKLVVLVFNRTGEERPEQTVQIDAQALGLKGGKWQVQDVQNSKQDDQAAAIALPFEVTDGKLIVSVPVKARDYRMFSVLPR